MTVDSVAAELAELRAELARLEGRALDWWAGMVRLEGLRRHIARLERLQADEDAQ